jgi:hypothetical protein
MAEDKFQKYLGWKPITYDVGLITDVLGLSNFKNNI